MIDKSNNAPFLTGNSESDLARTIRLAIVQTQYNAGNLSYDDALELLCGNLTPDNPATFYDDRKYLKGVNADAI